MRIEQFYIFVKIAETKSIRKASEAFFSTPQNLSKSMLQFEDELHTKLYHRMHNGIQLTEDGEIAYEMILEILKDIEKLKKQFAVESKMGKIMVHPVNIMACPVLDYYANIAIKTLFETFPEIPINDRQVSREIINERLIKPDEVTEDIILTNMSSIMLEKIQARVRETYHCYFLFRDELRLQVPKGSPYEAYDMIPLKLLETIPLLLFGLNPEIKGEFEAILEQQGVHLKNVSRTSNLDTCSQMALNSDKYCFVSYPSVELRPLSNVVYIPFEQPFYTNQIMLIKNRNHNKNYIHSFYEMMDQYFDLKPIF